ncbi:MAG: flagellar assembly protein T N-terminal domain-containing protein [Deltaproteobacteria bacterium]|nr:flagellar assembly protein T N-terminal domain-containing protein [Deltaproteobacteria bacterium]
MNKPSIHFPPQRLTALLFFLVIFTVLILPSMCRAENNEEIKTVDAVGYAPVQGGNDALARDAAVEDAKRKAVEQAVGSLVSSDTVVENYQIIQDNVYTKTQGYIRNYSVVSESHTPALYNVTIRATVAVGNIKNDLDAIGLLHAKAEKPRVLFMIAEQNIGHKYYTFWWYGKSEFMGETVDMSAVEISMKEDFLSKGFNVVDISGSQESFEISNAFKVADLTNDAARKIGKKLNAEIVIKGKAIAKEGPRTAGSAVGSYLADVTAQAIRVDTGAVLASGAGHGVSRHVSDVTGGTEALTRAGLELSEKMIGQILAKWTAGSNNVMVRITGVTDYKKIADFKNTLKKRIRGVSAVYQRRFEGGVAEFEIETKVPATSIADDLARMPGAPITVTNTSQNTIEAVMNP